jgi:membrane protein
MSDRIKKLARTTFLIFKHAAKQYGIDRVNRMAAAVSYRAIFAMAPLLILAVSMVGFFVGGDVAAQEEILSAVDRIAGPTVEDAVQTVLRELADTSAATTLVGIVLLLWTSSTLFLELQNDLNDIFGVPYEQTTGILRTIGKRGLGFLFALSLGLIVILVLLLNNIWQFLGGLFPDSFEQVHQLIAVLTPFVSVVVLPFVFALFFQSLSMVKVRWRAIWWGSLFTSVGVLVASYGASIYFRLSSSNAAGIAASLFVILLLAYIFSAVFLFGAELTKSCEIYLKRGRPPGLPDPDEQPHMVVDEPEPVMPLAAVFGFLAGLFIGWRRK